MMVGVALLPTFIANICNGWESKDTINLESKLSALMYMFNAILSDVHV